MKRMIFFIAAILSLITFMVACDTITEYKVFFEIDGTIQKVLTVKEGYNIVVSDIPLIPEKEGYDYKWSISSFDNIKSDLTVKAIYTPIDYKISYYLDGGQVEDNLLFNNYNIESDNITLPQLNKTDYIFVGWYDNPDYNGEPVWDIPIGCTGDLSFYALFESEQKYEVILNYEAALPVTLNGSGLYVLGDLVEISADIIDEDGYQFDGWYNGDEQVSSTKNFSFIMSENNITLTAKFKKEIYEVIAQNSNLDGGTIEGSGLYEWGSEVYLIATPNKGFAFIGWLDENANIISTESEYIFLMPKNSICITAYWRNSEYTLNLINQNHLAGFISGSGKYVSGEQVTVIAEANDGYDFIGWFSGLELVDENASYTFVMPKDIVELTAKWKKKEYSVTLNTAGIEGNLSGSGIYEYGQIVQLNAIANDGYMFIGWQYKGEIVSTDATYTFEMPNENCDYTAVWKIITHNLKLVNSDINAGVIEGSKLYKEGDEVIITATANTGYVFLGWFIEEELISSFESFSFKMPNYNLEYTAFWGKLNYELSISNENTEAGSVVGSDNYQWGSEISVTAIAYDGYTFAGWFDGINLISYDNTYTFEMPKNDINLIAKWQIGTSGLVYEILNDNTYMITGGNVKGKLIIPASHQGEKITKIGFAAFSGNQNITALEFASNNEIKIIESYAFNNTNITEVILPESLQTIESQAFSNNPKLIKVILPQNEIDIKGEAFGYSNLQEIYNLHFLYEIYLSNSTLEVVSISDTKVPDRQFAGYTKLKTVEFVGDLTSIGTSSFENCLNLLDIKLPMGLTSIGSNAFKGSGLNQIEVPESLLDLGEGAFSDNKNLKEVYINAEMSSIPDRIFSGATELSTFVFKGNLNEIGSYAFKDCINLNAFDFTEDLYTIKEGAFYNTALTSIILPEGLLTIEHQAFGGNLKLLQAFIPSSVMSTGGIFYGSTNLEEIIAPVTEDISTIGSYFYSGDILKLKKFTANGGNVLGDYFFSSAQNLQSISIGDTITQINNNAFDFHGNSILENIVVSKNNKMFSSYDGVLYNINKTMLIKYPPNKEGEFVVPQGIQKIENYAFSNSKVNSIILPNSINEIGDSAFLSCENLKTIDIPYSVEKIGSLSFNAMFEEINIPENSNIHTIGDYAFGGSFTEIHFPKTLKNIGTGILLSARNLQNITIPFVGQYGNGKGIVSFNYLFNDSLVEGYFGDITKVTILGGSVIGDKAFENMTHIQQIELPKSGVLEEIGERAFYGLYKVANIELFHGIKSIGKNALNGMSAIKQLFIPDTVDYIGDDAFYNMESLEYVRLPFLGPELIATEYSANLNHAFNVLGENCKIILAGGNRLSAGAFQGFSSISEIQLPNTILNIHEQAFKGLDKVRSLVIPTSVNYIGFRSMEGMSSLEEITLPFVGQSPNNSGEFESGLSYIFGGDIRFGNSHTFVPETLKKVTIQGGTKISRGAFFGLYQLEELSLPDSLTEIENDAFFGMSGIRKLSIPFIGKSSLEATQLINLFYYTTEPEKYSLPPYLTHVIVSKGELIEYSLNSYYIEKVELGSSVSYVSPRAFTGNPLNEIKVSKDNQYYSTINGVLFDKSVTTIVKFPQLKEIKSYSLPNTVINIGEYAFYQVGSLNGSLNELIVPASVENIFEFAFASSSINNFSFESNSKLNYIGKGAFNRFRTINELLIPTSTRIIENEAFSSLQAVSLHISCQNNLERIGDNAFSNIVSPIVYLSFKPNAEIGTAIFSETIFLEELTLSYIPFRLREFFGTKDSDITETLKKVVILDGESIPNYAFANTQNLDEIILPSSLKIIGNYAFSRSWGTFNIVIPEGVEYIGEYAFEYAPIGILVIPQSIISIGSGAFNNNPSLSELHIPLKPYWEINQFFNNFAMESIYLTADDYSVNPNTFDSMRSLQNIYVSKNNIHYTSVDGVLYSKDMSEIIRYPIGKQNYEYVLDDTVTNISNYAFYQNGYPIKITAQGSITRIGANAFASSNLEIVTFNGEVIDMEIGSSAFANSKLKEINIPNGTKSIGLGAFANTNLTTVRLPDGVVVGQNAFSNMPDLTNLSIGENVLLKNNSFNNCINLRLVEIPISTKMEESVFNNCNKALFITEAEEDSENWQVGWNNNYSVYYKASSHSNQEYEYIIVNETYAVITGYIGAEIDIIIPDELSNIDIYIIESYSFSTNYNDNLNNAQSIRISKNIEIIKKESIQLYIPIYCEVESKPAGWENNWAGSNTNIIWESIV